MLRLSTIRALAVALMLGGLLTSSATAAEWHTNGDKPFTSTNAGAFRFLFHNNGSPVVLACPSSTVSGTLNGPTSTATPWVNAATVTPIITSCTLSGMIWTVACSSAELRANSYIGGTTFATAGGGRTTGQLTSIDCRLTFGGTTCTTITGSVPVHYTNPNPIVTGTGSLTVTSTGQALTAHNIGGCGLTGPVTIGSPAGGTGITDITFPVDGPNAPYIYRTP